MKRVLTLPSLKRGDSTIHPAEPTSSKALSVLPGCPGAFEEPEDQTNPNDPAYRYAIPDLSYPILVPMRAPSVDPQLLRSAKVYALTEGRQ